MKRQAVYLVFCTISLMACRDNEPATAQKVHLPSEHYHYIDKAPYLKHRETVYVPIYSDIYVISGERRQSLTATLSVRNTSLSDTMYLLNADYYDSQGKLVKKYTEKPLYLSPLQTVEFIVDYKEDKGGVGANFIINWGAKGLEMKPIFQAVMVGSNSQHGVTFMTEGVVIKAEKDI